MIHRFDRKPDYDPQVAASRELLPQLLSHWANVVMTPGIQAYSYSPTVNLELTYDAPPHPDDTATVWRWYADLIISMAADGCRPIGVGFLEDPSSFPLRFTQGHISGLHKYNNRWLFTVDFNVRIDLRTVIDAIEDEQDDQALQLLDAITSMLERHYADEGETDPDLLAWTARQSMVTNYRAGVSADDEAG